MSDLFKDSPTPWTVVQREPENELPFWEVQDANGKYVDHIDEEEYALRIVACVNACAGLSTEVIEAYGADGPHALSIVCQQREELYKLIENAAEAIDRINAGLYNESLAMVSGLLHRVKEFQPVVADHG